MKSGKATVHEQTREARKERPCNTGCMEAGRLKWMRWSTPHFTLGIHLPGQNRWCALHTHRDPKHNCHKAWAIEKGEGETSESVIATWEPYVNEIHNTQKQRTEQFHVRFLDHQLPDQRLWIPTKSEKHAIAGVKLALLIVISKSLSIGNEKQKNTDHHMQHVALAE